MDDVNASYEILRVIKKVKETFRKNLEKQFVELKLTAPQGMLVGTLAHFGDMKVSDLSDKLGLSNSTVSGIIDRLEGQGYVERTRNEKDRRVVIVRLSPDFKAKVSCHFKSLDELLTNIISQAQPHELDRILLGLQTLDELMSRSHNFNESNV